jgi:hypothetical protein
MVREKLENMGDALVPMDDEDDSTQYLSRTKDEFEACEMAFKEKGVWKKKRDERVERVGTVRQKHAEYKNGKKSRFLRMEHQGSNL